MRDCCHEGVGHAGTRPVRHNEPGKGMVRDLNETGNRVARIQPDRYR
jgi:hypothetical protein